MAWNDYFSLSCLYFLHSSVTKPGRRTLSSNYRKNWNLQTVEQINEVSVNTETSLIYHTTLLSWKIETRDFSVAEQVKTLLSEEVRVRVRAPFCHVRLFIQPTSVSLVSVTVQMVQTSLAKSKKKNWVCIYLNERDGIARAWS